MRISTMRTPTLWLPTLKMPTMRTRPILLRFLPGLPILTLLLAGCGQDSTPFYQGYVEGDYVYVASSEAGRLDALAVKRGQQVSADAPLFTLEATRERAARDEASAQLAAATAQLEDRGRQPPLGRATATRYGTVPHRRHCPCAVGRQP
jgi:HlyD family secretion protein